MLTQYIQAAMRQAHYEILEDDNTFVGTIPDCQGIWANQPTLEACREELQEVLEEWILIKISYKDPLPIIDGIDISVKEKDVA